MRLAALIGLIDESDCVGECIEHHLSIGFDRIFVTDLGSTDGSREIVEKFEKTGRVKLLFGLQDLTASKWPTKMLRFAIADMAPDYVAHIDPDEFWIPDGMNIKSLKHIGASDVLSVKRFNAVQLEGDLIGGRQIEASNFAKQLVYVERLPLTAECPPRTPLYRGAIGPKIMHRGAEIDVGLGWHHVNDPKAKVSYPDDVVIIHYPLTSYDRFEAKIRNVKSYFSSNPHLAPNLAWHWRRMMDAAARFELKEEWLAQLFPVNMLDTDLRLGKIAPLQNIYPFIR